MLQPIGVTPDRRLVFGQRRLEAARLLGWERIPVHVCHTIADVVDRAKAERSENTLRKDFTPSELLAAGRRIAELERPKAKQRQREGGDHGRQARYSGLGSMSLSQNQSAMPTKPTLPSAKPSASPAATTSGSNESTTQPAAKLATGMV